MAAPLAPQAAQTPPATPSIPSAPLAPGAPPAAAAIPGQQYMGLPVSPEARADAFASRMVAQYGTVENALRQLAILNVQWSESYNTLSHQHQTLQQQVPAGAVIVPADKKALWEAAQALNVDAPTLQKMATEHQTWGTERTASARGTVHQRAAAAYGWNPEVLGAELERRGMDTEMRATNVADGRGGFTTQDMPYVKARGQKDAAWEPLATFVPREFSTPYQQALRVPAAAPTGAPAPAAAPSPLAPGASPVMAAPGIQAPAQPTWPVTPAPSAVPNQGDPVADFQRSSQAARDARPSPLAGMRQGVRPAPVNGPAGPAVPGQTPA